MSNILSLLLFISPPIVMLTGFAMSLLGSLTLFIITIKIFYNKLVEYVTIEEILYKYKLEFILAIWCIYTLVGKVSNSELILSTLKILSFTYFFIIFKKSLGNLSINYNKIYYPLLAGCFLAIIIFIIEKFSHGMILRALRMHVIKHFTFAFSLNYLDRGCIFLTLSYWVLCKILMERKKYLIAVIFYIVILYLLCISDCLSGLVAFIISGIVFLITIFSNQFIRVFSLLILVGSVIFPIIMKNIDPRYLSDMFISMPISAKERLYIWHFTANKIKDNLIDGIGLNHSRFIRVKLEQLINYHGHIFSPFQLHPHNIILQILLELGVGGGVFCLLIVAKYLNNIKNPCILAAFVNYYIVGMISYSMWQSWWIISGLWLYTFLHISYNNINFYKFSR